MIAWEEVVQLQSELRAQAEIIQHLRDEVANWKRLYESVAVKDERMLLYEEIKRLSNRVYELEKIVKQGVWPI